MIPCTKGAGRMIGGIVAVTLIGLPRVGRAGTWTVLPSPVGPGQLQSDAAVAVDGAGNLYVGDTGDADGRVQVRDPQGHWTALVAYATDSGQGDAPSGLAAGKLGTLYVADAGNNQVRMRDPQGHWTVTAGSGTAAGRVRSPSALALDGAGNLYVTDYGDPAGRIQKRDTQGKWSIIPIEATAPARLVVLAGIAVDGAGNVYLSEYRECGSRVQVRDLQGHWSTLAPPGEGVGEVAAPRGIAVDASGSLYVADGDRVQQRDPQGHWSVLDTPATAPGPVNDPVGLAVDAAGNLYVTDDGDDGVRVQKYTVAPPFPAPAGLPPGAPVTRTLLIDGVKRSALVYAGANAATTASPLVLVSHCWSCPPHVAQHGNGPSNTIQFDFEQMWPEATIVYLRGLTRLVVKPIGSGPGADYRGGPDWQFAPGDRGDRDLRFADALLQDLSKSYKVDPRRVYATGRSDGAVFVYDLLAARPDKFAAFAPVAGDGDPFLQWADAPRPILIIHGQNDPAFPFPGAVRSRDLVADLAGCTSATQPWSSGYTTYASCSGGESVVWHWHDEGHGWPAGAAQHIVQFFKHQMLPEPSPTVPITPPGAPEDDNRGALAGTGQVGFAGDGGPDSQGQLAYPQGIAVDAAGSVFFADNLNLRIRKVAPDGTLSTIAGSGSCCGESSGKSATLSLLNDPEGVTADAQGNLYIADTYNSLVARIAPDGTLTTVVGSGPGTAASGDGGPAAHAVLVFPSSVAVAADGTLFIADAAAHQVRRVDPREIIHRFAGSGAGTAGSAGDGGPASHALLNRPDGLALDLSGSIYIADSGNHRVRKVTPDGTITTVAGTGVAGFSGDGGPAAQAQLWRPAAVAVDSAGSLFIADSLNHRVREVTPDGTITTVAGGAVGAAALRVPLRHPAGLAIDRDGSLLITDAGDQRIRKVDGVAAPGLLAGKLFPPVSVSGDVDGDGRITVGDAVLALRIALGTLVPTGAQRNAADVDGDGTVSVADAVAILRRAIGP